MNNGYWNSFPEEYEGSFIMLRFYIFVYIIVMHPEMGQSLVSLHSRAMLSPL
jgi:hypothetical protein